MHLSAEGLHTERCFSNAYRPHEKMYIKIAVLLMLGKSLSQNFFKRKVHRADERWFRRFQVCTSAEGATWTKQGRGVVFATNSAFVDTGAFRNTDIRRYRTVR